MSATNRYPVYVPSKGRSDKALTIKAFLRDGVNFHVVVEPQERDAYAAVAGEERVLTLPESGRGLTYSRNWCKRHATEAGHARHWQFDDDIYEMIRAWRGNRLPCTASVALAAAEDFADRYENVALVSFNSEFFLPVTYGMTRQKWPPFYLNHRCYTVFLVSNTLAPSFRGRFNEDTDMSLQCLAAGHCTILLNAFLIRTPETMSQGGGQTSIYVNDGRLKMARDLERRWPYVVTTRRRFGRPQHKVRDHWKGFTTPLKLRSGVDPGAFGPNEYGLKLVQVAPEIKSAYIKKVLAEANQ